MKFSLLLLPVATTASSLADSFVTQNQHDSSNSWSSAAEFNSSNSNNASSHNNGRSSLTLLLDAFHHRDSNESTSVSGKGGEVYHEGRVESVPDDYEKDDENIGEGLVVRHDRLEDVEFMTKSGKALLDDDADDDDDDTENDDKEDDANDDNDKQPITSSKSSKSINQEKQRKKMEAKKQQHNSSKSFKSGESMAPTMMDDLL